MTSENELFEHFAGPSSTNVFIWWVYLLLSLFIASSDLRRNKKTYNCRNASNGVLLDELLLIVSLFFTHRLILWPCCRACLFMYGNGFAVADPGDTGARAPSSFLDQN